LSVVPLTTNDSDHVFKSTAASGAATVAVAGLPEMGESSVEQQAFTTESSGRILADTDFDQDLNDVFKSLVSKDSLPGGQTAGEELSAHDQSEVENLFASIAANYARPIKSFIFELRRGTATREWIEICRPAMRSITRAAQGMGLRLAAKHMVDFEAALSLAQKSEGGALSGELRDLLLWCYEDLIRVMPVAFVVAEKEQQREGVIINSLLMQIPDLGRVTVEKLYRSGLTSLDTLYLAKAQDLAVTTGISSSLSERICAKFLDYRTSLEKNHEDPTNLGLRGRLTEMVAELRRQHEGYQHASENEWSNRALASEKREYRQQRQFCVLSINVLLAEIGEIDLVDELEKLSHERRIVRLEEYLASAPATVGSLSIEEGETDARTER
jgi:hypothetical protein